MVPTIIPQAPPPDYRKMAQSKATGKATLPPYNLLLPLEVLSPGHDTQEKTLTCIFIALSHEHALPCPPDPPKREAILELGSIEEDAARLASVMLYTIDIDYHCHAGYTLSDADRTYFFRLGRWVLSVYQTHTKARKNRTQPNYSPHLHLWLLRTVLKAEAWKEVAA